MKYIVFVVLTNGRMVNYSTNEFYPSVKEIEKFLQEKWPEIKERVAWNMVSEADGDPHTVGSFSKLKEILEMK